MATSSLHTKIDSLIERYTAEVEEEPDKDFSLPEDWAYWHAMQDFLQELEWLKS